MSERGAGREGPWWLSPCLVKRQEQCWAAAGWQPVISGNSLFLLCQNQLSGYLLRKFKNSNGWQKLWVVFTNFCLFFYKTHQVRG